MSKLIITVNIYLRVGIFVAHDNQRVLFLPVFMGIVASKPLLICWIH